jgi:hypothetical protein
MNATRLRPVCFMVMPFGTKAVEPRPDNAPDKIDFDALWNKALAPVIDALGYDPVRADQETGAAIAALEQLVDRRGDSSERQGLIGGRYKKLANEARQGGDQAAYRDHLDQSIVHYERGMRLDLNDYYPTCNLPPLYKQRGDEGDAERAAVAAQIAMFACERAKARNPSDEWVNPTLLALAFDAADVPAAKRYVKEVRREGLAAWKLDTAIATLGQSVEQVTDPPKRAALSALLEELRALLKPAP